MSFVENLNDKRITIHGLVRILKVDYQREALLELILDSYNNEKFKIRHGNHFYLILENSDYRIFLILSAELRTINKINGQIRSLRNKETYVITFKHMKNIQLIKGNYMAINPKNWMNRIISRGIDERILVLQYLRDMEFYYE